MADAVAVVLAAGPATRMRTELPKPLHRVCGRPLLDYTLDAVADAGIPDAAVLLPEHRTEIEALVGDRALCVPPKPTLAEAVAQALAGLPDRSAVLFVPCDLPQLEGRHLKDLLHHHLASYAEATALNVGRAPTGVYAARRALALRLNPSATPPLLFTRARVCELPGEALVDVDTRADLANAEKALRRAVAFRLMAEGVTIVDPDNTYIDASVRIGMDTVVYPFTILEGRTEIGRRCHIGPYAHLVDCVAADDVTIEAAVIRESRLECEVRVGPFAHLRPGSSVGEGTKVGDFVELKNAQVGARVSLAHLAYVGDAEVGDDANLGAGVITCNYDGFRKQRTTIGANAFVGSNSVLIAPVTIGPGAYVAAHSAIVQDVPPNALGIARSRQENKPDWARRRRQLRRRD